MSRYILIPIVLFLFSVGYQAYSQTRKDSPVIPIHPERSDSSVMRDTFPNPLPFLLPPDIFIPPERMFGYEPWTSAPITRPVVHHLVRYGFSGSIGFGEYSLQHPHKFFSTLEGYNSINIPQVFLTQQMLLGNTFRLGCNIYYLSGIMYGSQMGVWGNNWGMGAREGIIWSPTSLVSIVIWTQQFQSVAVYTPVLVPDDNGEGTAIRMPATPEVFSFGVQANFVVGEFIIGLGTSVAPVPFQDRTHSEFHYK